MKYIFKIIYLILIFSVFVKYASAQDNHDHTRSNECVAKFTYSPNPVEQFTVHFSDHSTGLIQDWSWSFGDGTGSSELNPVHTFTSPGNYIVCLTISNTDSINLCYDVFCDTISIMDTIQCIAEFNYVLDSNSNTPNKYQFYDISTGGPDFWYWDFGDGVTSTEQNPQHTFNQEGQYNVCLVVAKSNIISCVDTICHLIKMPEYYSFGGFAFIGDQPINNPVHSGDTGIAFLYKVYPNQQVMKLDTNVFTEYGYFHFSNKLPGEYLIKVTLSPRSTNFQNYLSTYYPDHHLWTDAQSIFVSDSNAYNMHVYLAEIPGAEPGPGTISGRVVQDQHSPFERPFAPYSTEIILATAEGQSLDFTYCDSDGYFAFINIAYGSYKLLADHTGKYALPVLIDINEAFPYIDTVMIKVSDHNLTGIKEPDPALIKVGYIYPNPVRDYINIELNTLKAIQVNLQILDIHGSVKYARSEALAVGESKIQVPSGNLPKGVYVLMIRFQGGMYVTSRKFIK